VKVLDVAGVPDTKSFPPRLLIIFLGTVLGTTFVALFVLGSASWNAIDAQHPGKQFAVEVWGDLRNGIEPQDGKKRFWNRLGKRGGSEPER